MNDNSIYQLYVAELTGRYPDMFAIIKHIVPNQTELTGTLIAYLCSACKNTIALKRLAFKKLTRIEGIEETTKTNQRLKLVRDFKFKILDEISLFTEQLLHLIDHVLIPNSTVNEHKVTYYKMKADYMRYYCECLSGEKLKDYTAKTKTEYDNALQLSASTLSAIDPIRLGLSLNASVFYCELLGNVGAGCRMAKETIEKAHSIIEDTPIDNDVAAILQYLQDNLDSWKIETFMGGTHL